MEIKKLPVYYQDMEKHAISPEDKKKKEMLQKAKSNVKKQPRVFYKAISKIIAFGFNEK